MAPSRSENSKRRHILRLYNQLIMRKLSMAAAGGARTAADKMHTELSQTLYQLSYRVSPIFGLFYFPQLQTSNCKILCYE